MMTLENTQYCDFKINLEETEVEFLNNYTFTLRNTLRHDSSFYLEAVYCQFEINCEKIDAESVIREKTEEETKINSEPHAKVEVYERKIITCQLINEEKKVNADELNNKLNNIELKRGKLISAVELFNGELVGNKVNNTEQKKEVGNKVNKSKIQRNKGQKNKSNIKEKESCNDVDRGEKSKTGQHKVEREIQPRKVRREITKLKEDKETQNTEEKRKRQADLEIYLKIVLSTIKNNAKRRLSALNDKYMKVVPASGHVVVVPFDHFHGFYEVDENLYQCLLCREMVKDLGAHRMETKHMELVAREVADKHCAREIDPLWKHCMLCNEIIENVDFHVLCSPEHNMRLDKHLLYTPYSEEVKSHKLIYNGERCELCGILFGAKSQVMREKLAYDHYNSRKHASIVKNVKKRFGENCNLNLFTVIGGHPRPRDEYMDSNFHVKPENSDSHGVWHYNLDSEFIECFTKDKTENDNGSEKKKKKPRKRTRKNKVKRNLDKEQTNECCYSDVTHTVKIPNEKEGTTLNKNRNGKNEGSMNMKRNVVYGNVDCHDEIYEDDKGDNDRKIISKGDDSSQVDKSTRAEIQGSENEKKNEKLNFNKRYEVIVSCQETHSVIKTSTDIRNDKNEKVSENYGFKDQKRHRSDANEFSLQNVRHDEQNNEMTQNNICYLERKKKTIKISNETDSEDINCITKHQDLEKHNVIHHDTHEADSTAKNTKVNEKVLDQTQIDRQKENDSEAKNTKGNENLPDQTQNERQTENDSTSKNTKGNEKVPDQTLNDRQTENCDILFENTCQDTIDEKRFVETQEVEKYITPLNSVNVTKSVHIREIRTELPLEGGRITRIESRRAHRSCPCTIL